MICSNVVVYSRKWAYLHLDSLLAFFLHCNRQIYQLNMIVFQILTERRQTSRLFIFEKELHHFLFILFLNFYINSQRQ